MPRRSWAPNFALAMVPDLGSMAGQALLDRGGDPVRIDQRYHPDPIALICGRCSRDGWSPIEQFALAGYTLGLLRDDRLALSAAFAFDIQPAASNAQLGFDPAGQASALNGSGVHVVEAITDWRAGPVDARLSLVDGGGAFSIPTVPYRANSVIDLLRYVDLVDVDAGDSVLGCLEQEDNDVNDPGQERIRWGFTLDGRLYSAWPASLGLEAPTFLNAEFRTLAGVDGSETRQTEGDLHTWTAARMCRLLLVPQRPPIRVDKGHEVKTAGGMLRSGRSVLHKVAEVLTRRVRWYVDGPGSAAPLSVHTDRFLRRCNGDFIIYQQWGEPRRAIPTDECDAVEGTTRAPYDLVYTSERDGERGRLICNRPQADSRKRQESYGGMHRRKYEQELLGHLIWQTDARWPKP